MLYHSVGASSSGGRRWAHVIESRFKSGLLDQEFVYDKTKREIEMLNKMQLRVQGEQWSSKNVNSVSNNDSIVAAMIPIVVTINVLKRQMLERKLKDDTYGIIRFSLSQSYPGRETCSIIQVYLLRKRSRITRICASFIEKVAIL